MSPDDVVAALRAAGCVFAEDEAQLLIAAAQGPDDLARMVDRRAAGTPLEHILGWAEFCGLRIAVDDGVFVPRRRTEFLVQQAAQRLRRVVRPVVVDLCCGSGAVGAALVSMVDGLELYGVDIDAAAVRCARRNLSAPVYEGDLYDPLPGRLRGRVSVLVCNAPYVPTEAVGLMPPEAREHEPRVALDGGPDGLDVVRRVTATARQWLVAGGQLLFETSEGQAPLAVEIVRRDRLTPTVVRSDDWPATVVIATATASRRSGAVK